jgi:demethylmenaquinone methyltransferase/2-methoxy-6-polyprenyl-1,4-benzoquinol methylase
MALLQDVTSVIGAKGAAAAPTLAAAAIPLRWRWGSPGQGRRGGTIGRVTADLTKRPSDVAAMFDGVARRYDLANAILSLGQDRRWRRATVAALDPIPGDRILDLAAGTGTSTRAVADTGAEALAVDISAGMLAEAGRRGLPADAIVADAAALPFADRVFDAVTISFGLRNVADVPGVLREMLRVTRPGGGLVICEFSRPTWALWRACYTQYLGRALPRLARVAAAHPDAYAYLAESIRTWPSQLELSRLIARAGWERVGHRNLSGGIVALHRARRPGPRPRGPAGYRPG